jgi:hypothetical protein
MTSGGGGDDSSVYPSGSAFAAASAPMLPDAPVRFSTMMDWPPNQLRNSHQVEIGPSNELTPVSVSKATASTLNLCSNTSNTRIQKHGLIELLEP